MTFFAILLATLSIWEYPQRYPQHVVLRHQFMTAVREGDTSTMESTCRKGVKLLPDDPTWHYNLACSLAYFPKRKDEAFAELEKAIDLGCRDVAMIENDQDLKRLADNRRYEELIEYTKEMRNRPLTFGPMAYVDATGVLGKPIGLGEQNLGWDFENGCFVAHMKMMKMSSGGNVGDLYMNRDGAHSVLNVNEFPGLTKVSLDKEGRDRGMDIATPNILFPYPVFGNSSRAYTVGQYWRSIPRMITTLQRGSLVAMGKMYVSNQTWVFPANADIAPVGTNGDVFASITPYWITTAGASWSDQYYLKAALKASASFKPAVKDLLVKRGMLAPTIQTMIRKSLKSVTNDVDYLTARAHPTAFPANGLDLPRLYDNCAKLTAETIPPLTVVVVTTKPLKKPPVQSEFIYGSAFAWSFVLRAEECEREFFIRARGAEEYAFVKTHGKDVAVKIERLGEDSAKVTINTANMTPVNRVDITVVGKTKTSGWGAPSYISFARMDASAPYSDPALTYQAPAK